MISARGLLFLCLVSSNNKIFANGDNHHDAEVRQQGEGGPPLTQLCPHIEMLKQPTENEPPTTIVYGHLQHYNFRHLLWICDQAGVSRDDAMKVYGVRGTGSLLDARIFVRDDFGTRPSVTVYRASSCDNITNTTDTVLSSSSSPFTESTTQQNDDDDHNLDFFNGQYSSPCLNGPIGRDTTWKTEMNQLYIVLVNYQRLLIGRPTFALRIKSVPSAAKACDRIQDLGILTTAQNITTFGSTEDEVVIYDIPKCLNELDAPAAIRSFTVENGNTLVAVNLKGIPRLSLYKYDSNVQCQQQQQQQDGDNENDEQDDVPSWQCAAVSANTYRPLPNDDDDGRSVFFQRHNNLIIFRNENPNTQYMVAMNSFAPFTTGFYELELHSTTFNICDTEIVLDSNMLNHTELTGNLERQPVYNFGFCSDKTIYQPFQLFTFSGTGEYFIFSIESDAFQVALKRVTFPSSSNDTTTGSDAPCIPNFESFSCSGDDTLSFSTERDQTYHFGLAGYRRQYVTNTDYTLLSRLYQRGNICNHTTDLGVVGGNDSNDDTLFIHEDTLEHGYIYDFEWNNFCSNVKGPGRVYTMTAAQAGTIYVSAEAIVINDDNDDDEPFLRLAVYGECDTLRCDYNSHGRSVEVNDTISVFVYTGTRAEDPQPFRLIVELETADSLCKFSDPIQLGGIGQDGLDLHKVIAEEKNDDDGMYRRSECGGSDRRPVLVYAFNVSSADMDWQMSIIGYNGFSVEFSIYEPSDEVCENRIISCERSASWPLSNGTYYLLVIAPSMGDFDFRIEPIGSLDPCQDAEELLLSPDARIALRDSTENAPYNGAVSLCRTDLAAVSRTRLYTFVATSSGLVRADTTELAISVLIGDCASSCHTEARAHVFFPVVVSQRYYLAVHGHSKDWFSDYNLFVEYVSKVDFCSESQDLGVIDGPLLVEGTIGNASYTESVHPCIGGYKRNALYSLTAATSGFLVGGVSSASHRFVYLEVFNGTCENPICHQPNPRSSSVLWEVEAGQEYHIAIWSFSASSICDDAIELGTFSGDLIHVSQQNARATYFRGLVDCDDDINYSTTFQSSAVVYTVETNFTGLVISSVTGRDSMSWGAAVTVYREDCPTSVCLDARYSSREASWVASEGQTVFIIVHGTNPGNLGAFTLDLRSGTDTSPCQNPYSRDLCVLNVQGLSTSGQLYPNIEDGPTFGNKTFCAGKAKSPIQISSFAAGEAAAVSIEVESFNFESHVAVLESSCEFESELECSAYEDVRTASFDASKGQVYHVVVFPCCDIEGEESPTYYVLDIRMSIPERDPCDYAIPLDLTSDRVATKGFAEMTEFFGDAPACRDEQLTKWTLFSVVGTGKVMSAAIVDPLYKRIESRSVTLLMGPCPSWTCLDAGGNEYRTLWRSVVGVTYYLAVPEESFLNHDFVLVVDGSVGGSLCSDAKDIGNVEVGYRLHGSFIRSTHNFDLESCGPTFFPRTLFVYYSFMVETSQRLRLSVIGDTSSVFLDIYTDACTGQPSCVGSYDGHLSIELDAEAGLTYFLAVITDDYRQDLFTVFFDTAVTTQNLCQGAVYVGRPTEAEPVVRGSTKDAPILDNGIACNEFFTYPIPSAAYSVVGNGNELYFSVKATVPSIRFRVLAGDCSMPQLLTIYDGSYAYSFRSINGATYFVTISKCSPGSFLFDYALTIGSFETADLCEDTSFVEVENVVELEGDSDNALPFFDLHSCTETRRDPTVVYTMDGDGRAYKATLTDVVDEESAIYVAYGNCTSTICFANEGRELSFGTKTGVTYFIAVVGSNPSALGGFTLCVETIPLLANCGDNPVDTFPVVETTYLGTTINGAFISDVINECGVRASDWFFNEPADAFTFLGTGEIYSFSISNIRGSECRFGGPRIHAYVGSCENLSCPLSQRTYENPITLTTGIDEIYTIVVHSYCDLTFELMVSPLPRGNIPSDASNAENNIDVSLGERVVMRGSTAHGKFYHHQLPTCGSTFSSATNLYRINGVNGTMIASAQWLDLDSLALAVYKQESNSSLSCAVPYQGNRATWDATEDSVYLVAVFSRYIYPAVSDYVLTLDSIRADDICESVIDIGRLDDIAFAIRSIATGTIRQNITSCRPYSSYRGEPATVYKIQGNGEQLHASVYTSSFRGSSISLSIGNCSNPICLESSEYTNQQQVTWNSDYGTDYFVTVFAFGDYLLFVENYTGSTTHSYQFQTPPVPALSSSTRPTTSAPTVDNGDQSQSLSSLTAAPSSMTESPTAPLNFLNTSNPIQGLASASVSLYPSLIVPCLLFVPHFAYF